MVSWTGNEVMVEWEIENQSGQAFKASRLYGIFYPGALARDQAGNEGEYFIPSPIKHDLKPGGFLHYETKWLFFTESDIIRVHLSDLYQEGNVFVDISAEFVLWR